MGKARRGWWAVVGLAGIAASAWARQACPVRALNGSDLVGYPWGSALFREPGSPFDRLYVSGWLQVGSAAGALIRRSGDAWEVVAGAPSSLGAICVAHEDGSDALYATQASHVNLIWRYDGSDWIEFDGPPPSPLAEFSANVGLIVHDRDGPGALKPALHVLVQNSFLVPHGVHSWGQLFVREPTGWTPIDGNVPIGPMMEYLPPSAAAADLYIAGWWGYILNEPPYGGASGFAVRLRDGALTSMGALSFPSALAVFDQGAGPPLLMVGGSFTQIRLPSTATIAASRIAAWDGEAWVTGPPGFVSGAVNSLAVHDPDGSGPMRDVLLAGGSFKRAAGDPADGLAAWDGTRWTEFGGGIRPPSSVEGARVPFMRSFDPDGPGSRGQALFAAVNGTVNRRTAPAITVFEDGHWSDLLDGPGGPVRAVAVYNDGTGQSLFAAGRFSLCGELTVNNIARRNGQQWFAVGSGIEPTPGNPDPIVLAMTGHNDGSGWALYAAGSFQSAGGVPLANIARWNGFQWLRVGSYGLSGGAVYALESHDPDGPGPLPAVLYAGGAFTWADSAPANHLAWWDGRAWSVVPGVVQTSGALRAIRSFNEPPGTALYVGGDPFSFGGQENLAFRRSASGWEPLPTLLPISGSRRVNAFAYHDAGQGHRVHAIGIHRYGTLARLGASGWESLPSYGSGREAFAARSVDDGIGRALYADGTRFAGSSVSRLSPQPEGDIYAISPVFDDGNGPGVFMAGDFSRLGSTPVSRIAVVRVCAPPCYANCDGSTALPALSVADFVCFQQRFAAGDPWANCDESTAPPILNVADFVCFQQQFAGGCG